VTESNRPANIIQDRELHELLCAGCPTLELPSAVTVSYDIKTCFKKCQERVGRLLCVRTSFACRRSSFILFRIMTAVSTLRLTLGHHQTTVPSWPGLFTWSTMAKCFHFFLILLNFPKYVHYVSCYPQVLTTYSLIPASLWPMPSRKCLSASNSRKRYSLAYTFVSYRHHTFDRSLPSMQTTHRQMTHK
jgi:hypothetical protein